MQILGGRYRLGERMGESGTAVVWRAHDEVLCRPVAFKMLAAQHAGVALFRTHLLAEARAAAALTHPHIAHVYDYGEAVTESGECLPFIVSELLEGPTLAEVTTAGALTVPTALGVCAQVASALAAAHARGLTHGQVQPDKIVLTAVGSKLAGFGSAGIAGKSGAPNTGNLVDGACGYLAPEQVAGGEASPASDVYALGMLLYLSLTCSSHWAAATTPQMSAADHRVKPTPLPPIAGVSAEVTALCRGCLANDVPDRPDAPEVARVLAELSGFSTPTDLGIAPPHARRDTFNVVTQLIGLAVPPLQAGEDGQI